MASDSAMRSAADTGWRDMLSGAFDLLVQLHQRAVYRLCYRFMGRHQDAADLSQEVFLRAPRGLASFRPHSSLSTWLY